MQRLGLTPDDFRVADDLAKLPIIERRQLQEDPARFLSDAIERRSCLELSSGGSTGAPCTVYQDFGAVLRNAAHGERERSIIWRSVGRRFGYREAVIVGSVDRGTARRVQEFSQARSILPSAVRTVRRYFSLLDPLPDVVAALADFAPDVLHSTYGSYLNVLFPFIHASACKSPKPKIVTYSSDHLSDSVRRLITGTFGIPVLSTYQSIEAFKIGFECERNTGIHLNLDLYPVRIVDEAGNSLPPGETGEVVVSNLVNRATVLLNYRLGDLASISPDRCPCGRSLPLLSFLQGRTDEWVTLPSGRAVHPQGIRRLFGGLEEIWEYQVVQERIGVFRVEVVARTPEHPELRERIVSRFTDAFGEGLEVRVALVGSIERTKSGKCRTVVVRSAGDD